MIFAKAVDYLLSRTAKAMGYELNKSNLQQPQPLPAINEKIKQQAKSLFFDPLFAVPSKQYTERPSGINALTLRRMAKRNPIVSAIINTRISQAVNFTQQADLMEKAQNKPIGFSVIHKYKTNKEMSKKEKDFAQKLEDIISNTGYTSIVSSSGFKRDKFPAFVKKLIRDTLTLDQLNFEKVLNRASQPAELWVVDPVTIKMASPHDRKKDIAYVQVIDGIVKNTYSYDELAFCVRNPISSLDYNGYGFSELEQLIHIVAATLFADDYNTKFFSQGLGIQGILNIETDNPIPQELLDAFKREFQASAMGTDNAWKTPIMNSKNLQWINLKPSNRDMEYAKWMEYLIKITCAVFQISPSEINFDSYGTGGSPMFEQSGETKLKFSKDKGLVPLLNFISTTMTEEIVEKYDPNYMFIFTGLEDEDKDQLVNIRVKEVSNYKTIDEVREEAGLEPLDKGGDIILSPYYLQAMMMPQGGGESYTPQSNTPAEEPSAEGEENE